MKLTPPFILTVLTILCCWRIALWVQHLWLIDNPPVVVDSPCGDRGHPVIVNGEQVGCTGDAPNTTTWIPRR